MGYAADPSRPRAARDRGPGLCLSGGGFRAALFHLGALVRLNELGVLPRLKVITSVSGGSILNGILATRWDELSARPDGTLENFHIVTDALRGFCSRDLRTGLMIASRVDPRNAIDLIRDLGSVPARALARGYSGLMRGSNLGSIPEPGEGAPRFVFCATNVGTGACWQFHGGPSAMMGDFYTGYFPARDISVAEAVAASSAFPPGFGGLRLRPAEGPVRTDPWGTIREVSGKRGRMANWKSGNPVILSDGGIYDNLGVEPVWAYCRTLIVSDGGRPFDVTPDASQALVPRLRRAAAISAEQVGAVRKRWMVERIQLGDWAEGLSCGAQDPPDLPGRTAVRSGVLWAIDTPSHNYPVRPSPSHCYDEDVIELIRGIRTDMNAFSDEEQMFLINHGYWLSNAGISQYAKGLAGRPDAPFDWPFRDCAPGGSRPSSVLADSGSRRILRDVSRWAISGASSVLQRK